MPIPKSIKINKARDAISLKFAGSDTFHISAEFLRVMSPSAEVRGHSPDKAILQTGKRDVVIEDIQKTGNYALRIYFDDGHDSGIYSWDYLHDLVINHAKYWSQYLKELHTRGKSREKEMQVLKMFDA
ncbi:MAG: DUF971 domain-containing protein [Cellvibrionales bacterium TMED148]|nr:1-(5-phosphoribosyl)-5-((5-phosphoribosylamino)methylideneamino)imidazole-4-carboxamide isomerase [Porticoccaceae bacterium]RPG89323.1 MAG: DUF971 domain-containing protein [Cellvibrionales bacterium TMED148]